MKHPFYWNNRKILNFISHASNFLHEYCTDGSTGTSSIKKNFTNKPLDFDAELFEDAVIGIKEYMKMQKFAKRPRNLGNYFCLGDTRQLSYLKV